MSCSSTTKPNLILCGYTCAGKTTASQYLTHRFGYLHVEASDFVHLSYLQRPGYEGPVASGDWARAGLWRRSPLSPPRRLLNTLRKTQAAPIVVSGFRSPEEIDFLRRPLSLLGKNFETLFIEADEECRFERLRARMRPGDDISLDDFRRRDLRRRQIGSSTRIGFSQSVTTNAQRRDAQGISWVMSIVWLARGCSGRDRRSRRPWLMRCASLSASGLKDAILIALLAVWQADESASVLHNNSDRRPN